MTLRIEGHSVLRPYGLFGFCSTSLSILLSACAGTPNSTPIETRPSARIEKPTTPAPPSAPLGSASTPPPATPSSTPPTSKRGGGYYKDDGPDDTIPLNLADIPDAAPKAEALHRYANRPYVALGQSYKPKQTIERFVQRGIASWYGKRFHGNRTSSGERYDMYAMTAAHPTLPIPSYARVTRISNGRSVVVRINDRGPFHKNRVIDLSYAAAWKLDYINNGSAEVTVESILPGDLAVIATDMPTARSLEPPVSDIKSDASIAPRASLPAEPTMVATAGDLIDPFSSSSSNQSAPSAPSNVAPPGIYLQLGAFGSRQTAERLSDRIQRELNWPKEKLMMPTRNGTFRLQAGPFDTLQEAIDAAELIEKTLNVKPFIVQR